MVQFTEPVDHADMTLDRRLQNEYAAFMFKCNSAYLFTVENFDTSKGIWDCVAHVFP